MHFVYGFCSGIKCAAVGEYWRHFREWRILSKGVFSCVHQTIRGTDCLPSVCVQSEMEVVPDINVWQNILEMVQRSPKLSTLRIASRFGVLHMQVWWILHGEGLYFYHNEGVQHLKPGDLTQHRNLCCWITAHPQLLSVILFTNEVFFTQDGINTWNLCAWFHGNPQQTRGTNFERR
jgi:hypothetical protein